MDITYVNTSHRYIMMMIKVIIVLMCAAAVVVALMPVPVYIMGIAYAPDPITIAVVCVMGYITKSTINNINTKEA